MRLWLFFGCFGCSLDTQLSKLTPRVFVAGSKPTAMSFEDAAALAEGVRMPDETVTSLHVLSAAGIGESVAQVVTTSSDNSRGLVVHANGMVETTNEFWAKERATSEARFGKMTPLLFEQQKDLEPSDRTVVDIFVYADLPEPVRPFDGTDMNVPVEMFEDWTRQHAQAQATRLDAAKARVLKLLSDTDSEIVSNPRGLPIVRASVSAELLRSGDLNTEDVVRIDPIMPEGRLLGDHAGHASMNWFSLTGGLCGGTPCTGGGIDVGLWERDSSSDRSGLARNNTRLSQPNIPTGYFECPKVCSSDSDCSGLDVEMHCQDVGSVALFHDHNNASCATSPTKVCVQDHLTWVAASVGMVGNYNYNTTIPTGGTDGTPNVPGFQNLSSGGAWQVDFRIGNAANADGLNYLIMPADGAPPTPYINRSQGQTVDVSNFPGRAFGTFMTAASGNSESGPVSCAHLKNGLCVGMYDYKTFNDLSTHRRTAHLGGGDVGSSFLNDTFFDPSLERPHVLGPGNHDGVSSGEHMPSISNLLTPDEMRQGFFVPGGGLSQILGTSFAAPSVLSAAIVSHQYKGWFSALAFPMVNKATLLAATQDANADGPIGKSSVWSNQPTDAEDGAGQIDLARVKQILDSNQFYYNDLADSSFVACGSGCRKFVVGSVQVPASWIIRVALVWQACMTEEGSFPLLNNDLDLALNCGSVLLACGGTTISNTVSSETEMIERPACSSATRTCSIEIRIKNGAALASCGTTATERVGVAWGFH